MTRLVRPAPATLIVALVLAMFLAGAMSLLPAGPAHAQGVLPTITVEAVGGPGRPECRWMPRRSSASTAPVTFRET